jgi:hypothetical protein
MVTESLWSFRFVEKYKSIIFFKLFCLATPLTVELSPWPVQVCAGILENFQGYLQIDGSMPTGHNGVFEIKRVVPGLYRQKIFQRSLRLEIATTIQQIKYALRNNLFHGQLAHNVYTSVLVLLFKQTA